MQSAKNFPSVTMICYSELKQAAQQTQIDDLGIVVAGESSSWEQFCHWLDQGHSADMDWLRRTRDARRHPVSILDGVRTMLVALFSLQNLPPRIPKSLGDSRIHLGETDQCSAEISGVIASYATGIDYHRVVRQRLEMLALWIAAKVPNFRYRIVVDTAPLAEKEWAVRAGLGAIGLHSLLIHPQWGSRVFIGTILTTLPPECFTKDEGGNEYQRSLSNRLSKNCSACRRCQTTCPTKAILGDGTIDARRCLNYWTIEYREETIPQDIRSKLEKRLFGCELCQEVCPQNIHQHVPLPEVILRSELEKMTSEEFDDRFGDTPVKRIGLSRLQRNARWLGE